MLMFAFLCFEEVISMAEGFETDTAYDSDKFSFLAC